MASTYLTRTISDGSNTKSTFSAWVKRSGLGATSSTQYLFHTSENTNNDVKILFNSSDVLRVVGVVSSSTVMELTTNRKFRDITAWYHIVVTIDTTESTAADRVKMYINGVQETSFSTATYPAEDYASLRLNNNGDRRTIGTVYDGGGSAGSGYFDGSMSHVHWVDGTAYQASTFGSTDATTGEWKINTSPTLTMGTNGFTILKDGNTITDQSANSNDFTLGAGTLINTEDCPSNVFCTLSSLGYAAASFTLIEGNNYSGGADNNWRSIFGTLGAKSGKYYYEMKCIGSSDYERFGACTVDQANKCTANTGRYDDSGYGSEGYGYTSDGEKSNNGGTSGGYGDTWGTNDILSCALDLDNNKIYFGKNGTWQNSGDPTSGSTGTGAAYTIASDKFYIPAFASYGAAANLAFNFGNGYFRTTAISSEGTNASGIGKFEYDVPAGYTALSTKGLNE
tara:strand:+ start:3299 stop:4657 length:1359 start_codon:yes stop_codon:yes gene_type:complete